MSTTGDRAAARREFVRTHHPDRGGDPETFMTGLAGFDSPSGGAPRSAGSHRGDGPVIAGRPRWRRRVTRRAAALIGRSRTPRVR